MQHPFHFIGERPSQCDSQPISSQLQMLLILLSIARYVNKFPIYMDIESNPVSAEKFDRG